MKALERAIQEEKALSVSPAGSGRNSPAIASSSNSEKKTAAERRFEEVQRKRVRHDLFHAVGWDSYSSALQLAEKVAKLASKSHKDRVSEFNAKLEALSEHHDIPKVRLYYIWRVALLTCKHAGRTRVTHAVSCTPRIPVLSVLQCHRFISCYHPCGVEYLYIAYALLARNQRSTIPACWLVFVH